ncbi:hypothetical protein [Micromonospora aurantiaca (nom. illeg.)]|uniref:hypothetical protein n=1 Tax=Micromonospora aurantiaca (nom. illeg.) TaxID=47850 RepID=UPI003F4A70CE
MRIVVSPGGQRQDGDGNKRYRPIMMDFDTRANILATEIQDDWEPSIREQWHQNQERVRRELIAQFGENGFEAKLQNFVDLGAKPFSILAYHNQFLDQARFAFIIGAYYPALVGACTLGERILNHLVINLRHEFVTSPHYKNLYKKQSFDNWPKMIEALRDWEVLLPPVVDHLIALNSIRNSSVHFRHELDRDARQPALEAIRLLEQIIDGQFSAFGSNRWFIPNITGASFLRREAEDLPFIRLVFIPNCFLVSNRHQMHFTYDGVMITDEFTSHGRDLTDEQFASGEF